LKDLLIKGYCNSIDDYLTEEFCNIGYITLFPSNLDSHTIETRQRQNLYLPQANLPIYQKGVHYAGMKIFNKLPRD
jgi:hypothetical protein